MSSPLHVLALGDSYTVGEGVSPPESWPIQLVHQLRQSGLTIANPHLIAQTGWTTAELTNAIATNPPTPPFDLVTLLIGVNNQYRGLPTITYKKEFTTLLQQAITFANSQPRHVLVLSIPDWSVVPFAANHDRTQVSADIATFNTINQQISHAHHVQYVNITPLTQQAAHNPALTAIDGLHPSATLYSQWVQAIYPTVHHILTQSK